MFKAIFNIIEDVKCLLPSYLLFPTKKNDFKMDFITISIPIYKFH
jgi:hypothetical protein